MSATPVLPAEPTGPIGVADADRGARALLIDGAVAIVRQLGPRDTAAVLALHLGLAERDRYFRFFGPTPAGLVDLVTHMTRPTDLQHGALGIFGAGGLLGVAHYVTLADPTEAEVAVAVTGTAQVHGVGTLLLDHLVPLARRHGVRRLLADVLSENGRMMGVFARCGVPCRVSRDGSVTHVELVLDEVERHRDSMAERERVADTASLRALLRPDSLVVVSAAGDEAGPGAGHDAGPDDGSATATGAAIVTAILAGGFTGVVYAVQPDARPAPEATHGARGQHVAHGVPTFTTVDLLPVACDLAVLCVPADQVAAVAEDCGRRGIRALVVIGGEQGIGAGRDGLTAVVRRHGLRLVGPGSWGIANSAEDVRLDAVLPALPVLPLPAGAPAPAGSIGLVTQAGSFGLALRDRLAGLGLGVSTMVSTGEKCDVSGNDLLLWWWHDPATTAVAVSLESFGNPRKFGRLARELARTKPVLVLRAGRDEPVTAQVLGEPSTERDALFRAAGIITVETADELVGTLAFLSCQPLPAGHRIALLGMPGTRRVELTAEDHERAGTMPAELLPETETAVGALLQDGGEDRARLTAVLEVLREDPGVDAVIVTGGDPAGRRPAGAPALLSGLRKQGPPVLGTHADPSGAVTLSRSGSGMAAIPCYHDVRVAAAVVGRLAAYAVGRHRSSLPPTLPAGIDVPGALIVLRAALRSAPDGGQLTAGAAADLLHCFGIGPGAGTQPDPSPTSSTPRALPHDLSVRIVTDGELGPLVTLGNGSTGPSRWSATALAPLTDADAEAIVGALQESTMSSPSAQVVVAVRNLLVRVGHLAHLLPEVVELTLPLTVLGAARTASAALRIGAAFREDPFVPHLRA